MAYLHFAIYITQGEEFTTYIPPVDVPAGTPIQIDPETWGISAINAKAFQSAEFRIHGVFRGIKANPSEIIGQGDLLDFTPDAGFTTGTGRFKAVSGSGPGESYVSFEINPVGTTSGSSSLPTYVLKDRGEFDPLNPDPTVTDAGTARGDYYHVRGNYGTDQVINFGHGNVTFPANVAGELVRNSLQLVFYPYGSASPGGGSFTTVANLAARNALTPNDGDTVFVQTNRLTYIWDEESTTWFLQNSQISASLPQFVAITEQPNGQVVFVTSTDVAYEWDSTDGWKQVLGGAFLATVIDSGFPAVPASTLPTHVGSIVTLNSTDIANKYAQVLTASIASEAAVYYNGMLVNPSDGTFSVNTGRLSWTGLGLEAIAQAGDVIQSIYVEAASGGGGGSGTPAKQAHYGTPYTVLSGDVTNKYAQLIAGGAASEVAVFYNGVMLNASDGTFDKTLGRLSWTGLGLEPLVQAGDIFQTFYVEA